MFVVGAHMVIDNNAAALIERQSRVLRERAVRAHADRKNDQVGIHGLSALQLHGDVVSVVLERRHTVAEIERHAVLTDILMQELRHFKVDRSHHLICCFDQADPQARVAQVFRHFQPDKAASDDCGGFRLAVLHHRAYLVRVGYRPERADFVGINALDVRSER